MKKYFFPLYLLASLLFFVSCDNEADKIKIETETLQYAGHLIAGIYVPNHTIENELFDLESYLKTGAVTISADSLACDITIDVVNSGSGALIIKPTDSAKFHINLFDRDMDISINEAYKNGPLGLIYNAAESAYFLDDLTLEEFNGLREIYTNYTDIIEFSPINTGSFPLVQRGVSIVTFDDLDRSYYADITLNNINISRKSSLDQLLKYTTEKILPKVTDADAKETITTALNYIAGLPSMDMMHNAQGWLALTYSNYVTSFELTAESNDKSQVVLLDNFSKLLFGSLPEGVDKLDYIRNPKGKPAQYLWLEMYYEGSELFDGNWKEVK